MTWWLMGENGDWGEGGGERYEGEDGVEVVGEGFVL